MGTRLVIWSLKHPKAVIFGIVVLTLLFGSQLPKIKTDTDPKHMLPATSDVRVYNDKVEERFELHADVIVLGIVSDKGVLHRETLAKIAWITDAVMKIPGVVAQDVISFTTADHVLAEGDNLYVRPVMPEVPGSESELQALRKALADNPLFMERLISKDGKTTAIYIPIEKTANGKVIADRIQAIVAQEKGDEVYHLAGDPVARDTFGAEMFKQMGLFSPIAGMLMFIALLLMFRNLTLVVANMGVAMISVIWSMGGLIGLNIPVHIMSSMSPVFLMAIATDTVHIFNEFYFRYRELGDKRAAILETMKVVSRPIIYTDLTTAAGFACLATGAIIPVKIFGLVVAFGTLVILLMSFTLVPAVLSLIREEKLARVSVHEDLEHSRSSLWLQRLGRMSIYGSKAVVGVGVLLLILSVVGIQRIRVNNNMVTWFKPHSDVRVADAVMNRELGGTAMAYLVAAGKSEGDIKHPETLRIIEGLQRELEKTPLVGKTTSIVDVVKRINRVMHRDDPAYEVIPGSTEVIAQYLLLFSMAAKPRDLNNFVDYPYQQANIWVQLKTWDATAMREVLGIVRRYTASHSDLDTFKPAGIAYFNMVWNDEVLYGMLHGFIWSAVLVFLLMVCCFRSLRWGIVAILPLLFSILVIYGFVGFIGKDFDMPISVLSTLSLGLATDFAIHFVGRFRQRWREQLSTGVNPELEEALVWTVARPGKGIVRNAVLFALGFSAMVLAALTPYITVGLFMAAIMLLSSLTTLIYLPAMVDLCQGWLLKNESVPEPVAVQE